MLKARAGLVGACLLLAACAEEEVVLVVPVLPPSCEPVGASNLDWIALGDFAASGDVVVRTGVGEGLATLEPFPEDTRTVAVRLLDRNGAELAIGRSPDGALTDLRMSVLLLPRGRHCSSSEGLGEGRREPVVVALPGGGALVLGGDGATEASALAERFDAETGLLLPTRTSLGLHRVGHTATALLDGRVLVAGGEDRGVFREAEVYDPADDRFREAPPMTKARSRHAAVAVAGGQVLVVGGEDEGGPVAGADLYDDDDASWTAVGSLEVPRSGHAAVRLSGGDVLVVGGVDAEGSAVGLVERYGPSSRTFVDAGWSAPVGRAVAALLPSDAVLVVGEVGARLLAPDGETLDLGADLAEVAGAGFAPDVALTLPDGTALVQGSGSAVRYSAAHGFSPAPALAREGIGGAVLADGAILLAGGDRLGGGGGGGGGGARTAAWDLLRFDLASDYSTPVGPLLVMAPIEGVVPANPSKWVWVGGGPMAGYEGEGGAELALCPGRYRDLTISFKVSGQGTGFVRFGGSAGDAPECSFDVDSAPESPETFRFSRHDCGGGGFARVFLGVASGPLRFRELVVERR